MKTKTRTMVNILMVAFLMTGFQLAKTKASDNMEISMLKKNMIQFEQNTEAGYGIIGQIVQDDKDKSKKKGTDNKDGQDKDKSKKKGDNSDKGDKDKSKKKDTPDNSDKDKSKKKDDSNNSDKDKSKKKDNSGGKDSSKSKTK